MIPSAKVDYYRRKQKKNNKGNNIKTLNPSLIH